MAIDQHGHAYHGLTYPRKELTQILNCKHVDKMYVDTKNGEVYQTGYVIAGSWLRIFEVIPMSKPL